MKNILGVILFAALSGAGLGVALGYLEGRLPDAPAENKAAEDIQQAAAPVSKGPVAEVPETTFNFNRMEQGSVMRHAFKVLSRGSKPLHVDVVNTTCKCTVGGLSKSDVPPGEETEVLLEWTAKQSPGPFRHGATLETNDPRHSRIELVVEGEVVESTSLRPSEFLFGKVQAGDTKEASCYLISSLENDVKILHHKLSNPELAKQVEISTSPIDEAELDQLKALSAVKVTATFQAGKAQGPFFGWLELETNLQGAEKLSVPLSGNVVGDISIFGPGWISSQNLLQLGPVDSKTGKKARLLVAVRGEQAKDTQLTVASVDPKVLKVTLGDVKQMGENLAHFPLILEVPAGTPPMVRMSKAGEDDDAARGDGVIVLDSTHPITSEVRLKVRFSVE
ncbi:DUF1573 domain-containing protein [Bythopirellula polymerisocia]|uniref:DUF1573 domain-containing protein n=1 Tax=Bythopirellula polymerisocia TaxID=2528003 RepID=A0A5C6CDZ9_9BACT|nr:DUF1573 domain-containing protein [Bythopirellula polymerisocia]TWU21987.1 hypothetical protein Pla144_44540 [Bythopirellula polymerisocia]